MQRLYMALQISTTNYKRKLYKLQVYIYIYIYMGRDSAVGIATHYGLEAPGIEARRGARFSATIQTGPGTHPAPYTSRG